MTCSCIDVLQSVKQTKIKRVVFQKPVRDIILQERLAKIKEN